MERLTTIQRVLRSCMKCIEQSNCYNFSCENVYEALDKLADYEDKQEQGLLIELKVPLGTRIWYLEEDYHENTVEISTTFYDFRWLYCHKDEEFYLTRSEAEEALARMKG